MIAVVPLGVGFLLKVNSLVSHLLQPQGHSGGSDITISWVDLGSERITGGEGVLLFFYWHWDSLCFPNQTSEGLSPAADLDTQQDGSIVFLNNHRCQVGALLATETI